MSLYPELDNFSLPQLVEALHQANPEGEEFNLVYYQEITLRIRQQGDIGIEVLWNEIDNAKSDQLRAILFALTMPAHKYSKINPLESEDLLRLYNLLKTCLENNESLIIAEAIEGFRSLEEQDVVNQVLGLYNDSSPYVKGSVLRYMAKLFPEQAYNLLIQALNDPHFIVRENALDELGELGRPEAIPHIQPFLTDEHPHVRQAAETALEFLND